MADIRRYPFVHHLRADPTMHVRHLHKGHVRHDGPGASFWFTPRTAAIAEVPLDDREQALLFHARTADFQDVVVQATLNYRVVDAGLAMTRIDFGIRPEQGGWLSTPLELLGGLLTELAQQPALELIATMGLEQVLAHGITPVRNAIATALGQDERLAERGLAVTDIRVVGIRTDPEVERALATKTREQVQQQADRATFERRAHAVERERAIAENELQNQIELARREEDLVTQRGSNERRRATEQAAATKIETEATAGQRTVLAQADADAIRVLGEAEGAAQTARLAVYATMDSQVLLGLALKDLAANLPNIESLTITPDMLTNALGRLADPGRRAAEA